MSDTGIKFDYTIVDEMVPNLHSHLTVHRGHGSFLQVCGYTTSERGRYLLDLQKHKDDILRVQVDLQLTLVQERSPDDSTVVVRPGGMNRPMTATEVRIRLAQQPFQTAEEGKQWVADHY